MLQSTGRQNRLILIATWIAALDCLAVAVLFNLIHAANPGNAFATWWPIPGVYFIELAILAVLAIFAAPGISSPAKKLWHPIPWISVGIILIFVVLGALSIGLFLYPALLAFMLCAVLAGGHETGSNPLNNFAYLLLSLFLLSLLTIGAWSLASSLTVMVLAAGIVLLLLAVTRLPQGTIWRNLSFFFLGGFSQTLLMYLLLQLHV